jgi:molybdopterin-guanine dinucleotide biosynthesis protein A
VPQATDITALILAGGQGRRMGGVDKGLQPLHGEPLLVHTVRRLQQQTLPPARMVVNANRHLDDYAALGLPVWRDSLEGFAGPLAGFLSGLQACDTPLLLTVPCDTPGFPRDLIERLQTALAQECADMAMPVAPDEQGQSRLQPVFCLMRRTLLASLQDFLASGQRKIEAWTHQHRCARVHFDQAGDAPGAFFNTNTLAELQQLERSGVFAA